MPVVIREFEVVAEPQIRNDAGLTTQAQPGSTGPTPQDMVRIIRHQLERLARVRAH